MGENRYRSNRMAAASYRVEYHGIAPDYLLHYKTVYFSDGHVNAPFVSQEPQRWTAEDRPLQETRGFNEVYLSISPEYLDNDDRDLQSEIERALDPADDGEPAVVFFEVSSEETVDIELLEVLVDLQIEYSAFLATPLRPEIADAINSQNREVDEDEYFDRYESTRTDYLDIVDRRSSTKPVLGGIPVISRRRTREVILDYLKRGITAICVDFNGRSPMVPAQVENVLTPLQAELGFRDWHEDGFLYAINADRGQRTQAGNFLALAAGFDGLGGYHTGPRGDEEFFDWLNERPPTTLRIFETAAFRYREHPIEEIVERFPPRTNLDAERVQALAERGSAGNARKVLNAEQLGLAANELRRAINVGNAAALLRSKSSVDGRVRAALRTVRESHDRDSVQGQLPGDD